jgi:CoA:oxalate CoA-transferase
MMLADLGARVVKVERPGTGDDARAIGPFGANGSAYFASVNRGKESIDLDLRAPADRAVLEALFDRADVVVENFRPGAMAKLGYGWDDLSRRWPRVVMVSISGFGQTGPLRDRPAYDMVVQAMGGIMSITGEPGGRPTRVGTSIGDIAAGMFAAFGAVAALHQRHATGRGALVDVSMLDCQVALLENAIARYATTRSVPGPIGSRHPSITPFGLYETASGGVVIAAGNDDLFATLCATLGADALAADPRFASNAMRTEHEAELRAALEEALSTADAAAWLDRLEAAGVPCAPVHDVGQVLAHPQTLARRMVQQVDDPAYADLLMAGNPVKVSTQHDRDAAPSPPALGQHKGQLLAELGLS